jgi:hypothetical protein
VFITKPPQHPKQIRDQVSTVMLFVLLCAISASHALKIKEPVDEVDAKASNAKALKFLEEEAKNGFPNMPSISDVSSLKVKIPEDACQADLLLSGNGHGLGSELNNYFNALAVASYADLSVALIDNTSLSRILQPNFEHELPVCVNVAKKNRGVVNLMHRAGAFITALTNKDHQFVRDLKLSLYKQYYQLNEETQADVTDNLKKMGVPLGSKYVGIHIRRGDKPMELGRVGPGNDEYAKKIQDAVMDDSDASKLSALKQRIEEQTQSGSVYVASDDSHAQGWMTKKLGDKYLVKGQQAEGAKEHDYDHGDTMLSVLTDIEALRNAEVFIGTASSNFGRLVYFLRSPEKKSISLDEDWLRSNGDGEARAMGYKRDAPKL